MLTTNAKNWSVFHEDTVTRMRFTVSESIDGAAYVVVDYSASTAKVYFRAWREPVGTQVTANLLINAAQTKIGGGTGGIFETKNTFTAPYGEVMCSLVSVDEAVVNALAPSGYQEEVIKIWKAKVSPSIQP